MAVKRVAGLVKAHIVRQLDRQVFLLLGNHATSLTMHHRNGAAPIPLAREAPVAQAELGHTLAKPLGFHKVDRRIDRLFARGLFKARKVINPADFLGLCRDKGLLAHRRVIAKCEERINHWQVILAAEVQIALVMRRAGKDSARAVVHQNEVGDPDRKFCARQRMLHFDSRIIAQLLSGLDGLFGCSALARFRKESINLGVALHRLGDGMVRRNPDKARAVQRIGPRGVNNDRLAAIDPLKPKLQTA